jgi:glycosyltransferase involved in cell wall biosynthesis
MNLITVLFVGTQYPDDLKNPAAAPYEANTFDTFSCSDDESWQSVALHRPHVIITCGDHASFPNLLNLPLEWRRRWLHFPELPESDLLAQTIEGCFVDVSTVNRFPLEPLISIQTPCFRSGSILHRTYQSLVAQTYSNWEWVMLDDNDDNETWEHMQQIAAQDPRVRIYRQKGHNGNIGDLKRKTAGLSDGSIFVELDHDDELTNHCLADLLEAFTKFPDAGFAYTDCTEVFPNGFCNRYGEGWGLGYGSYRVEQYNGRGYDVTNYPPINRTTMRHIVGVPNHVRAWKADAYWACGGHSPQVHVADDYELLVRTFLTTKMIHIKRLGYIQYVGGGQNTQTLRNAEIQRMVRLFANRYWQDIDKRFEELGIDGDDNAEYILE